MPRGSSPTAPSRSAIDWLLTAAGPKPRILVGFSGGLDSTVLAHMLVQRRRDLSSLRLMHVDHGLQTASADWSRQCARQARAWRVTFLAREAKVRVPRGDSLEAVAREARYAHFQNELQPGEILVTAQHRDDQAETLLLQLFRGAGVAGLAAMPRKVRFAPGWLMRPLLAQSRAQIESYARYHQLAWLEDPSNQQQRFGRNFLRHQVMPLLRDKWPGVDETIARSARHMAEAGGLLDSMAWRDQVTVADGDALNVAALRRLPGPRRRNLLRAFIAKAGAPLPSTAQMNEISTSLLIARADAQPQVDWPGGVIRRRAGRLELQVTSELADTRAPETVRKSWRWNDVREYTLNVAGDSLTLVDDPAGVIDLDKLPRVLQLRARSGGENLRPGPRARTQSLKKLMQAARFTVEQRARLPLLFAGVGPKGRLIAAGDRWLDASVMANVKSRRRARLIWKRTV